MDNRIMPNQIFGYTGHYYTSICPSGVLGSLIELKNYLEIKYYDKRN